MELPSANQERLTRIRANLENTLAICSRAKQTLERSMSTANREKAPTTRQARAPKGSMSYRDYVELSSIEEYQKFKNLPPIENTDLESADIDDLLRKLYDA